MTLPTLEQRCRASRDWEARSPAIIRRDDRRRPKLLPLFSASSRWCRRRSWNCGAASGYGGWLEDAGCSVYGVSPLLFIALCSSSGQCICCTLRLEAIGQQVSATYWQHTFHTWYLPALLRGDLPSACRILPDESGIRRPGTLSHPLGHWQPQLGIVFAKVPELLFGFYFVDCLLNRPHPKVVIPNDRRRV